MLSQVNQVLAAQGAELGQSWDRAGKCWWEMWSLEGLLCMCSVCDSCRHVGDQHLLRCLGLCFFSPSETYLVLAEFLVSDF